MSGPDARTMCWATVAGPASRQTGQPGATSDARAVGTVPREPTALVRTRGAALAPACSRAGTMTAAQPDGGGVPSLEVRWIFSGPLVTAMAGWFGRFPAQMMAIEDVYLLDPHLPGLSVKVRGGRALEVKMYRGSPGFLQVAGRAHGRLESWQKWSFPCDPSGQGSGDPAGWGPVSKRRRISQFSLTGGPTGTRVPGPGEGPGCAVELTEVRTRSEAWWTLGFEATGPAGMLHSELKAAAALVFAQALPSGVELGMDYSMSYAQWLRVTRYR